MTNEIITLKNQFEDIAKTRGKAKIPLIKKYATDPITGELFKRTYEFVFSPFITTGIAKKKMNKDLGATPYFNERNDLLMMFGYVIEHNTGTDEIIKNVQSWILGQPAETHEFLKNVFINDLKIGASEKAINEALGYEFIPVWEVMLAHKYEKNEDVVDGEFFITLKMDDHRCTCEYDEEQGKWVLKARSGLPYEGVTEIEEILEGLPKDQVFDGGLIAKDPCKNSKERFRLTGSILRTDGEKKGLMFYIYDMIPKDEFRKGKSKEDYKTRQQKIEDLLFKLNVSKWFTQVPRLYQGTDKTVIMDLLEQVLADENEGLIINLANGKYERKRVKTMLKVKEFYTCDLLVTGYKEYKHPNMLGAFICDYKGNQVSVGGGFKHHERKTFWENRDVMIGRIIEVKYFQESKNQNGGTSIRHGHFIRVRTDKNEPSYD